MMSTLTHLSDALEMVVVQVWTRVAIGQVVVVLELEESHGRVRWALLRNKTRRLH